MRVIHRAYRYWPPVEPPIHSYDSGLRALPIILLTAFGVGTTANGISLIVGLSFLFSLLISVSLSGCKLYFLLRYEPSVRSRRDKTLGYVILAIILTIIAAFGLYGLNGVYDMATFNASAANNNGLNVTGFLKATVAKSTYAIVCWIIAIIVEVIVLILVVRDRQEYDY